MITYKKIETTLSKAFADSLNELVMDVGKDLRFTRKQMIDDLGCANFQAARRLEKILRKLKVYNVVQLNETDPFSLIRVRGIGQTSIYVAMCILDFHKYDVGVWWKWYGQHEDGKFSSYKSKATRRATKRKHEVT